jgi:NAD(P)-dependent dehydrogenase (short-subunit alcohol dehydrogenase family)
MSNNWTVNNMPDLRGKLAIVTGANSGIGFYTALELGRAGAKTIVASRDKGRGETAIAQMRQLAANGDFVLEQLDLADLRSIKSFAERILTTSEPIDLLINNAGLMMPPQKETTADGFEIQFGTNHLGHFALTGLLLSSLKKSTKPLVVTISSLAAMRGKINLTDLQSEKKYSPYGAYAQSKLANLLFMLELGRRCPEIISVAAQPGVTITNLQKHAFRLFSQIFGQHASEGALPTLRAAVEPTTSGKYYGPKDYFGMRGAPVESSLPGSCANKELAQSLWQISEQLTGVTYQNANLATSQLQSKAF